MNGAAAAPPVLIGPHGIRQSAEALSRECGRLCCVLGVDLILSATFAGAVQEGLKPGEIELLDKLS